MAEEISLKPCPFCGGQPVVLIVKQIGEGSLCVQCSACGVGTPGVLFASRRKQRELLPDLATARRQAVDAWNDRV